MEILMFSIDDWLHLLLVSGFKCDNEWDTSELIMVSNMS